MAGNIIDMGNGKCRLRVSNGFDLNGKRKYYNKTVSCSSKRDAEKELAKFITSIEGGCTYSSCYDKETASKMLNKLFETAPLKYQCFVTLATLGGFRRGEIVGLHWDDIDFKNKTVTINRSAYYLGRQGIKEKPPKTDSSNRTIAISDTCISLLKRWRAEQGKMRLALGDRWHGVKNIFTTDDGNIMNPATGPKWFSKFLKKTTFHIFDFMT